MKHLVILAMPHEFQEAGHFLNSELDFRLKYFCEKFDVKIVMEEWSESRPDSRAKLWTSELSARTICWENIGTPYGEEKFSTYLTPINVCDPDAPSAREYGPFENQENREVRFLENILFHMRPYESGLLILGLAHLHSMYTKLASAEFDVRAYTWLELPKDQSRA